MTKNFVRGATWTAASLLLTLLVVYLLLVAINWNDEAPSANALGFQTAESSRPAVLDDANAYVYLLGFSAPASQDPVALGSIRKAWLDRFPSANSSVTQTLPGRDVDSRSTRPRPIRDLVAACNADIGACAATLNNSAHVVGNWSRLDALPLRRYEQLITRSQWLESIPRDLATPLPRFTDVLDAQRLYLMQTWLMAREEGADASAINARLDKDLVFWRNVLASSDILITKMIASAAIKRHFELGNLALHESQAHAPGSGAPSSWTRPLNVAEHSLARTFAGEWNFAHASLLAGNADESTGAMMADDALVARLLKPLYRGQATSNLFADRMARLGRVSELPANRLREGLAQLYRELHIERQPFRLYNPVGNLLDLTAPETNFDKYILRVHDLEGARRAALLAAELRQRNAAGQEARSVIRASGLREPYVGKAFTWSAEEQAVVFQGAEPGERGRYAFSL